MSASEVMRMVDRYRNRHRGWNVKHYYAWYQRDGGWRREEGPYTGGPVSLAGDDVASGRPSAFMGAGAVLGSDRHRCHYVKAKVRVLRYTDGSLSIHHGPRELAKYDPLGQVIADELPVAA